MKMFGLLRYSIERILVIVSDDKKENVNLSEFKKDFSNAEHPVFIEYDKGYKNADYAIEIALFEKAKEGDTNALEQLEDYRGKRQYEVKVMEMFDV
jgi:hypothetical protein